MERGELIQALNILIQYHIYEVEMLKDMLKKIIASEQQKTPPLIDYIGSHPPMLTDSVPRDWLDEIKREIRNEIKGEMDSWAKKKSQFQQEIPNPVKKMQPPLSCEQIDIQKRSFPTNKPQTSVASKESSLSQHSQKSLASRPSSAPSAAPSLQACSILNSSTLAEPFLEISERLRPHIDDIITRILTK